MATRVKLIGVNQAFKPVLAEVENVKKKAIRVLKDATIACVDAMMQNTPVWQGVTVRNYGIGIGKTGRRSFVEPEGGMKGPPMVGGKKEPTNTMPLGSESRRSSNERAAWAEITSMLNQLRKVQNVIIFNSAPEEEWDNIENAQWPGGKGQRVRNRAVVSRLGEQRAKEIVGGAR